MLPVKGFARAKSRLGEVLSDPVRVAFARGLFEHVLGTLRATPTLAQVLVLTDDDEVEDLALASGALVLRDSPAAAPGRTGLAQIIDAGLAHAASLGAEGALVCMADLPRVSVNELCAVTQALASSSVVLAPDAQEAGTNLLALAPATLFSSRFGRADSFQQHLAAASALGQQAVVVREPGLRFDVDDPQDLEDL